MLLCAEASPHPPWMAGLSTKTCGRSKNLGLFSLVLRPLNVEKILKHSVPYLLTSTVMLQPESLPTLAITATEVRSEQLTSWRFCEEVSTAILTPLDPHLFPFSFWYQRRALGQSYINSHILDVPFPLKVLLYLCPPLPRKLLA